MTSVLSTPPAMTSGCLAAAPQPVLPASGGDGLLLRPWERGDAAVFLSAYRDEEARRWHTHRPSTKARAREWSRGTGRTGSGGRAATGPSSGTAAGCSARMALRGLTKAGYRLEGTKRNAAVHDDGRHDMHLHARVRGD